MKTKLLRLLPLVLIVLCQNVWGQTQMPYWSLPPYKIDFTASAPTASSLPTLNAPTGITYDGGFYYITDELNHSIYKINSAGDLGFFIGRDGTSGYNDGDAAYSRFNKPKGIIGYGGDLYIADAGNNRIRKINSSGIVSTFAGSGVAGSVNGTGTAAQFNNPTGIVIDGSGNLYVTDSGSNKIRKITPAGVVTTFAGSGVAGSANGTGTAAQFNNPTGITIDGSGNLFVTDYNNHLIRKITSTKVVTTLAGSSAGFTNATGTSAQFNGPYGITIDDANNLYVTEKNNHTIRKITSAGIVTTFAGTGSSGFADGTGTTAQFNAPAGIFNFYGDISVADYGNKSLRKVTTSAVVTKFLINETPYVVSNAAYDEAGNILFYVKNDVVYSATGMPSGKLEDRSSGSYTYSYIMGEIAIVPVPGSCRDFYVFYIKGAGPYSVGLCCAQITVSSTGNIISIVSSLIQTDGDNFMDIAASKLDPVTNTRSLYCLATFSVKKYTISASGLSSATTVASTGGPAFELELSHDGSTLAWAKWGNSSATITTIPTGGGLLSTYSLSSTSHTGYGIEFAPDNNYIYVSAYFGSGLASNGVYKLQRNTSTFTQVTSNKYSRTQLELARDGYIYAVDGDGFSAGTLGRIDPVTGNVTDNILAIPIRSTQSSLLSSGFYRLPDQVDNENYSYFFGIPKLNAAFTINSSITSPTVAINTYTCSAINLGNSASGASAYRIIINKTDATGNILTGASAYAYNTGLISTIPPSTIDIKSLNSNYLASNTGFYKIDFYVQNICGSSTVSGLIQNSTLSAASANFKLLDGLGNELSPNPVLPGDAVSAYGVALSGKYSTGYISTYQIKVDKVDCTTGAVIVANIVNTPATAVINGDPSKIAGVSLNSKSSPLGYFTSNAGCFKVTYTVANACGTAAPQIGYFNSDPSIFRVAASNSTDAQIYPNPTTGSTTVVFALQSDKIVQGRLICVQGGMSYTLFTNQSVSAGQNEITFDVSAIPAGMYLYQLSDGTDTFQTGKIVIVK